MADLFSSHLEWTGAGKGPTRDSATFSRDLKMLVANATVPMSSAPAYRGDPSRANPEQLFVAALSACQALTYLALAARKGVTVVSYSDDAQGQLNVVDGKMRMSDVTLHPQITLAAGSDEGRARELVEKAHDHCFITNSVLTRVEIVPTFEFAEALVGAR